MVMNWKSATVLGAAALCLAACAQVIVHAVVGPQRFSEGEYDNAAKSGEIRTVIVGNPFRVPKADLDRAVTGAMRGAPYGPPTTFTTSRAGPGSGPYRVVIAFNAPRSLSARTLCGPNPSVSTVTGTSDVRLFAAFCLEDVVLSEASGHVSGVSGPDAHGFRALVAQVTTHLFPGYDFHDIGGDQTM